MDQQNGSPTKAQNVQVVIRVRPLTTSYQATNGGHQILAGEQSAAQRRCIRSVIDDKVIVLDTKDGEKFTFDYVAGENRSQDDLFKKVGKPVVDTCIQGYNSTIFAYGQTGSGKTFTIQGMSKPTADKPAEDQRGILPRQFEYLFGEI